VKLLRRLVVLTNGIFIIFLILGYLRQFIDPGNAAFLTIFSLLYPYIVIALLISMILLVLVRSRFAWISLLALVLTSGNTIRQIGFHVQPQVPDDSTIYTITTLNIKNNFRHNQQDQSSVFIKKFKEKSPTFLALQEVSGDRIFGIARQLGYPYHSHLKKPEQEGFLAIFSKFPMFDVQTIRNSEGRVIALFADIKIPQGMFRLVNIHLHTNAVTVRAGKFSPESFSRKEGLKAFNDMLKSYGDNASLRLEEIELIQSNIENSPFPVILAGDANDTPYSPVYLKLADSMQNAFVKGGLGFAQTYNGLLIPLKIDHIFLDQPFTIFNTLIEKIEFSDHNPITTSFTLQN